MKHEKKPEFEPWNKKELAIMQLSLGQEQQKRLKSLAEIRKIEQGLHGINKEIETNIGTAELKLKVATALANYIKKPTKDQIIPAPLDKKVAKVVAQAVKKHFKNKTAGR